MQQVLKHKFLLKLRKELETQEANICFNLSKVANWLFYDENDKENIFEGVLEPWASIYK